MQHTEDNKLIAQFMGGNHNILTNMLKLDIYGNGEKWYFYEQLKYNSSWDWLMPVVEKISLMNKTTGFMGVFTLFNLGRTKVQCYNRENLTKDIDILDQRSGIAPTYKAVVEFIKWYNENK